PLLEDPGSFPACNFAVDIDANVVMVLNDLPAEAALNFNAGTKPRLNLFRFGERGPYALRWVRDVAFEDHFVAIWAFSSDPSRRAHCMKIENPRSLWAAASAEEYGTEHRFR